MNNFYEEIKQRISMPEMMRHYGFELDRSGFCKCPLHGEKTGSFKAYSGNRGFYCFGCGAHGSVIDFVMIYFGLTFSDALEKINADFSLGLPIGHKMTIRQLREMQATERKRKSIQDEWQSERHKLLSEYDTAFSEWIRLDNNKREYAPQNPADDFHPLFVEALQKIDGSEYDLRIAEMRLADHENRRPSYSDI